jgi:trans-2,3-dihydro-3-hydroxyanthranilate isomerase
VTAPGPGGGAARTARRYRTVDVFSERAFGGNPLAVVLDAAGLTAARMQAIAAEFNYAETTFVLPPADARHTAQVRIFTPRSEVPFAGHPNVGTAFVLALERQAAGAAVPDSFAFEEGAGVVPVRLLRQADAVIGAELAAPRPLTQGAPVARADAAACLSLPATGVSERTHAPLVASVGLPFLVAELASREELVRARPDAAAHARVLPALGVDAIYAYVRAPDGGDGVRVLHARMFAPLDGIPEDPATGSATAATLALLTELDAGGDGEWRWRVHQGDDMGRPSLMTGVTSRRAGQQAPVRLGGHCAPIMSGTLIGIGDDGQAPHR